MSFLLPLTLLFSYVFAQSSFSPARPPDIPLAVRNPYQSTWLPAGSNGGNGGYLAGEWPSFWAGAITGWTGFISVDGTVYTFMGNPQPLPQVANQTAYSYTSTRSIFEFNVGGKVNLKTTFLSPVTPNDMLRQSFPVTYFNVDVASADGGSHDVHVYTDVSAEWASGDRTQVAQWQYNTTDNIAYHRFWRQDQQEFTEESDQASWGYWYYATENCDKLTYQSGADVDVRRAFTANQKLNNTQDTNYRAINDAYPVFGLAVDLGSIGSSDASALFTLNLAQENTNQLNSGNGNQSIPAYWTTKYSDEPSAVDFFYGDYSTASSMADDLDKKVQSDSDNTGFSNYATLTTLAVRQAFGALQLAGDNNSQYLFLKEISSDGDIQTVDVIYPFWPILMYLNPAWGKLMLDPLFEYQAAGLFQPTYSLHDLGLYPNAIAAGPEEQPVEECGNMLIMTLSYAQRTGDTAYLSKYYNLLKQWTQYLIDDSLYPGDQISTDDFAGSLANQTDLALKGMIGIAAMSKIAQMTGNSNDAKNYSSIATNYISQWQNLGIAHDANPPHTTLSYGANDTHGLLYNLWADVFLQTELVPQSVYKMQSDFYPTVNNKFGVPLDTRHNYTKNDWELWCAAIADHDTAEMFISDIVAFINQTPTDGPASDLYETQNGDYATDENGPKFIARPVVGGWFSFLAINSTGIPSGNPS